MKLIAKLVRRNGVGVYSATKHTSGQAGGAFYERRFWVYR